MYFEDALGDNAVLLTTAFNHGNDMFEWNAYLSETDSVAVNENAPGMLILKDLQDLQDLQ